MRHPSFGEFPARGIAPRIGLITDDRENAMNTRFAKLLPLLLAVLMLSACGGGGGSGPVSSLALFTGDMAGVGNVDGAGAAARFNFPRGVATDNIRKITPGGVVTTLAGAAGLTGRADATGAAALFNHPNGVGADNSGNVYVADTQNSTIRKITPAGDVSTLAGTAGTVGSADATGATASFNFPRGVATDSAGNVYVADTGNHTIRKITPGGVVTTLAGAAGLTGSADATGAAASFSIPFGVATDSAGNVYVADTGNNTIRKITPAGDVSTLAGTAGTVGSTDATGAAASFNVSFGVAADSTGNVYVADEDNNTIRKITPAGEVSTLAGTAGASGSIDATGAAARFNFPRGVATDNAGNIYVADAGNHTIRKITPAGDVSTLAGTAGVTGSADGTGAAARFNFPFGVAIDSVGNVYVADTNNHTIRKITPAGDVTTLAGSAGIRGSTDAAGTAARFSFPLGVATDSAGNVYVADVGNDTIRKITPAGVVGTLAGSPGTTGSADGIDAAASFNHPSSVATDNAGNVYVADTFNHTIRKITPAGDVSTLAGTAGVTGSADGTGAAARFNFPRGVATDSAGNVYVADTNNSTIRKITPTGVVTTVVGVAGQAIFVPGALPGLLAFPQGVAVSGSSLYVTLNNGVAVVQNRP